MRLRISPNSYDDRHDWLNLSTPEVRMQKWEYKMTEGWLTSDQLDALGNQGWELVSTAVGVGNSNMAFYFKRPARTDDGG
jgi:hypothetical protein